MGCRKHIEKNLQRLEKDVRQNEETSVRKFSIKVISVHTFFPGKKGAGTTTDGFEGPPRGRMEWSKAEIAKGTRGV